MAILNISELRAGAAAQSRRCREGNRWLVVVYCAALAVLSLGSSGLNLLLDGRIGQTGGLDGLGMRAVLQTIQEILYYVNFFFAPFWTAGFLYAMLGMVRGGTPQIGDLTGGFRNFGRVLGHMAFWYITIMGMMVVSVYLAAVLFSFSSWGAKFAELMVPVLEDPNLITPEGVVNMELIPVEALSVAMIPMLVLTGLIFVPVYLYMALSFRMSLYLVMERSMGGVRAHFESVRLMKGHKWQLLKLDLHYWWYYLLGFLAALLGYLDQILLMLGLELPMDGNVMYFVTMSVYFVLNFAICLWKKCEVDAAHILAYDVIAYPEQAAAEC